MMTMGTDTADGFIPHKLVTFGNLTFEAPVRVVPRQNGKSTLVQQGDGSYLAPAEFLNGKPVFALPGGYVLVDLP